MLMINKKTYLLVISFICEECTERAYDIVNEEGINNLKKEKSKEKFDYTKIKLLKPRKIKQLPRILINR